MSACFHCTSKHHRMLSIAASAVTKDQWIQIIKNIKKYKTYSNRTMKWQKNCMLYL